MKWINSARVSLALSATALFVALGGTAVAVSQIGTSQIRNGAVTGKKVKNGAITSKKLAGGAVTASKLGARAVGTASLADGAVTSAKLGAASVTAGKLGSAAVASGNIASGAVATGNIASGAVATGNIASGAVASGNIAGGAVGTTQLDAGAVANGNLANNAVTSAKVQDGSLTSSDVASNTFLAASGTAVNSQQLGGLTAAGFIRGTGRWVSNRVVVPAGGTAPILELNFAFIQGTCPGSIPTQSIVAELPLENALYTAINFGNSSTASSGTTDVSTANALSAGSALVATHANTTPQTVTWQAAYNDGKDEIATAWVSGQDELGSCVFIAQGTTTLG
jgi:hypothetical protein